MLSQIPEQYCGSTWSQTLASHTYTTKISNLQCCGLQPRGAQSHTPEGLEPTPFGPQTYTPQAVGVSHLEVSKLQKISKRFQTYTPPGLSLKTLTAGVSHPGGSQTYPQKGPKPRHEKVSNLHCSVVVVKMFGVKGVLSKRCLVKKVPGLKVVWCKLLPV